MFIFTNALSYVFIARLPLRFSLFYYMKRCRIQYCLSLQKIIEMNMCRTCFFQLSTESDIWNSFTAVLQGISELDIGHANILIRLMYNVQQCLCYFI
ncbi:hypothetical protein GDO81_020925 [Engystomops pustulosus]|uniref:Uncharacterized protein n=1 Tax=Engystomops pustulosus TaxID=76066 RepID=A0AAV6YWB8_ENGPU|nr:hypothetical protein GDO81_020925 [Engystomops pustulosus]